jgi:hypothetical protein
MTSLLLFVLQVPVLFHGQIQTVQALYFSIALPLAVRSPYLSCWLPLVNGSDNAAGISPTRSTLNLSQVGLFLSFDPNIIFLLSSLDARLGCPNPC